MLVVATALAQTPSDAWKTVRTEHFRLHYPVLAEPWALLVAGTVEELHARVVAEVGSTPRQVVDIVVVDPYSLANGAAYPVRGWPRMELFATAPKLSDTIGYYRSWAEELVVHEDTHLVHMLIESRNPLLKVVQRITGFGPVAAGSPRWVIEGYATVVEGRLTGWGRPNSDSRALLLRVLARQGRLPTYGELNGSERYLGYSFAYLVGSAYLEWLELGAHPGALRDLWMRMSARETRSFDQAFRGVFGAGPVELYGRWCAELTRDAMAAEPLPLPPWLDPAGDVLALAGSDDGGEVALVRRPTRGPLAIEVYGTGVDEKAVQKRIERHDEIFAKDDLDVRPVPPEHPPRERLARRTMTTRLPLDLAFTPDGDTLLVGTWSRDRTGRLRPDLYRWAFADGSWKRVTRRADLRSVTVGGDEVVAVHQAWGQTNLVRVDLERRETTPLTDPSPTTVVDRPALDARGERLAWLRHDEQGRSVVVRRLSDGTEDTIPVDAIDLAWNGGRLYAVVGDDGDYQLHAIWPDRAGPLTAVPGGLYAAAPQSGAWLGLGLDHEGPQLFRTVPGSLPDDDGPAGLAVLPPPPDAPAHPATVEVESRRYGLGPMELAPLIGAAGSTVGAAQGELGVRIGDLVGRTELVVLGSLAPDDAGFFGGGGWLAYSGLPVEVRVRAIAGQERDLLTERASAAVSLYDRTGGGSTWVEGELGALVDLPFGVDPYSERRAGFATLGLAGTEPRTAAYRVGLELDGLGGAASGDPWVRLHASTSLWLGSSWGVGAGASAGASTEGSAVTGFALGGLAGSLQGGALGSHRVDMPAFAAPAAVAHVYALGWAEVGRPQLAAYGELADVPDGPPLADVGLRTAAAARGTPLIRLPGALGQAGVGCRLSGPGSDAEPPCSELDDWSLWAAVRWTR